MDPINIGLQLIRLVREVLDFIKRKPEATPVEIRVASLLELYSTASKLSYYSEQFLKSRPPDSEGITEKDRQVLRWLRDEIVAFLEQLAELDFKLLTIYHPVLCSTLASLVITDAGLVEDLQELGVVKADNDLIMTIQQKHRDFLLLLSHDANMTNWGDENEEQELRHLVYIRSLMEAASQSRDLIGEMIKTNVPLAEFLKK